MIEENIAEIIWQLNVIKEILLLILIGKVIKSIFGKW